MRPVLRLLGSRYGIALMLLVVVLAVVGVTRSLYGSRPAASVEPGAPLPQGTVSATAGDDGPAGADGLVGGAPAATGTTAGTAATAFPGPDPVPAATTFLRAWLAHNGVTAMQWYAGIAPLSTPSLGAKLKATDPAVVPADRMTGTPAVFTRSADHAEVTVTVDSGAVRLRLLLQKGRWLVDGVDWERG